MASPMYVNSPSDLNNKEDTAPTTDAAPSESNNAALSSSQTPLLDTHISSEIQNAQPLTLTTKKRPENQHEEYVTCTKESLVEPTQSVSTTTTMTTVAATATTTAMSLLMKTQHHGPSSLVSPSSRPSSSSSSTKNSFIDNNESINNDNVNDNNYHKPFSINNKNTKNNINNNNKQQGSHINTDSECSSTSMIAMAAAARAANTAMQLQILEAINEVNHKRQHSVETSFARSHVMSSIGIEKSENTKKYNHRGTDEVNDNLTKILLPKCIEKLSETVNYLQNHQPQLEKFPNKDENISSSKTIGTSLQTIPSRLSLDYLIGKKRVNVEEMAVDLESDLDNPYKVYCKECGENFENDFKLNCHIIQEHNNSKKTDGYFEKDKYLETAASIKVKQEFTEFPGSTNTTRYTERDERYSDSNNEKNPSATPSPLSPSWLKASFTNLNFPFLSTTGGSALMPLLGLNPSSFTNIEGVQKPTLRIFNPEAFCELCNKEFCNKYFLKTHKANKHGIYENTPDIINSSSASNVAALNRILQIQMQQRQQHHKQLDDELNESVHEHQHQHQHQHQSEHEREPKRHHEQHQEKDIEQKSIEPISALKKTLASTSSGQYSTIEEAAGSSMICCDICSKRFANIFALRRHWAKAHEHNNQRTYPESTTSEIKSCNTHTTSLLSFATNETKSNDLVGKSLSHEFALEQEYVSFTPQPRKLSPHSQQQALEHNFAHEKLKHLGVLNPDTFCKLCCKEYCNKYFLRTHKWRRHGIYMPPDDIGDDNEKQSVKLPFWPTVNLPLNLMTNTGNGEHREYDDGVISMENQNVKTHLTQSVDDHLEASIKPIKRIKLEVSDEDAEVSQDNKKFKELIDVKNKQLLEVETTETTNIGIQNLQKLQTMIQQLTDISDDGGNKDKIPLALMFVCPYCGQDMINHYALQSHIISEHNAIATKPQNILQSLHHTIEKQSPNSSPTTPTTTTATLSELRCTACNQEFITLSEFHKHIAEIHLLPVVGTEGFITPERPISATSVITSGATRPPYSITPTSSYCEICNKELCNKYFMKTHMQRMHGIEIENGAQIGGVVCNICNKELCSKYFLRVHKHNTHGIIEDGSPVLPHQSRQNGLNFERQSPQNPSISELDATTYRAVNASPFSGNSGTSAFGCSTAGMQSKLESLNATHEICPVCTKRFRTAKLLRHHLQNEHSSKGSDDQMQTMEHNTNKPSSSNVVKVTNETISLNTENTVTNIPSTEASSSVVGLNVMPSSIQLAQALRNLNAQHLINSNQELLTVEQHQEPAHSQAHFKEYQCSLCTFTTPYYAFLYIHEKTHSITADNSSSIVSANKQEKAAILHEHQDQDQVQHKQQRHQHLIENVTDTNYENVYVTCGNGRTYETAALATLQKSLPTPQKSPNQANTQKNDNQKLSESTNSDLVDVTIGANEIAKCSRGTSPIQSMDQQLLNEIATKTGQIATYGVPNNYHNIDDTTTEITTPHMQPFTLNAVMKNDKNPFLPAIVYLPVKERLTDTVSITFKLTPKSY